MTGGKHKITIFISVINQFDTHNFCFTINLFHVKQTFCASSWLITEINILRRTVSKTSKNKISNHHTEVLKEIWVIYYGLATYWFIPFFSVGLARCFEM